MQGEVRGGRTDLNPTRAKLLLTATVNEICIFSM